MNQKRSKFSEKYEWVQEKHGSGPTHFHGSVGVHQVEIYPNRKQEMNLEFYFDIPSKDFLPQELQTQNRTFWSLKDPEGRNFIVGLL